MSFSVRTRVSILLALAVTGAWLLSACGSAAASSNQLAMLEEDVGLLTNPSGTLSQLRSIGVGIIRMSVNWNRIAPDASSGTRPAGFDATNPASYPAAAWAPYDAIVKDAQKAGITVEFAVTGPAPLWATGSDQPSGGPLGYWKPSAGEYGQFMQAIASRYSGRYQPAGSTSALPKVGYWEIYNEPNWGKSLAPQAPSGSANSTSPGLYRALLNAGWSALQRTGHGRDTILVGSLSPRGWSHPGAFLTTKPLVFIRALYCVDSRYRRLSGGAATAAGCPNTSASGFRSQNPALFNANGFGIHPYPFNLPPNRADSNDPDFVEFNELPRMASALDRAQGAYGPHRRMQIFNTEYGYETNPPNRTDHFVSPATAAYYINWAEYMSWRNGRVATTMQYLLYDPNPHQSTGGFGQGGFATGLIFYHGRPKADYYAYRLPLYLPVTSTRRGRSLEVWGCARPAHYANQDTHRSQQVQIQFQARSRGAWRTIKTVTVRSSRGYFDLRLKFPSSGSVRLAWSYPRGDSKLKAVNTARRGSTTVYSRVQKISIR